MQIHLSIVCALLVSFHLTELAQCAEDLYETLGVGRTASSSEIKRAYKKLARNWHPDKNKDSNAQEMFIKINRAYETLSNDENRRKYDNYGHVAGDHQTTYQSNGRPFFDQHSGFSFFYQGMPFQYHAQWKDSEFITLQGYENTIVPSSTKKVYLMEVVSEWCMSCMELEDIWETATHDLKSLGVGVGINSNREPKLISRLNVKYAPSIIGIAGKRVYKLSTSHLTVEKIKKFVSNLFPVNLVEELSTMASVNGFLTSWHDNKPRVLLFSPKETAPILYKVVAYGHRDRMEFGFISLTKSPELKKHFNVQSHEPTVLVFKDEGSATPDLVVEASQLQVGKLLEIVSQNRFLNLPRLSSQPLFDELCPQENFQSRRKLCVVLFTEKGKYKEGLTAYKSFASDTEFSNVQFTYMYEDMQEQFLTSLKIADYSVGSCDDNTSSLKVGVFWHKMDHKLNYNWLIGGWCRDRSRSKLRVFLEDIQNGKKQLTYSSEMVELFDELEPGSIARIYGLYKDAMYHVRHTVNWNDIFSALIVVAVFGFIILLSVITPSEMFDRPEKKTPRPKANDPTEGIVLGISQLKHATYTALITAAPPGQYTIVVLLDAVDADEAATSPVMQAFADIVYAYSREQHLRFTWLSIPDHITWCTDVMRVEKFGEVAPGTVLALNGNRMYYSAFKPTDYNKSISNDDADFIGFNDSDSENEHTNKGPYDAFNKRREKIATLAIRQHFSTWMEKLCCGLIKRDKLENWPIMEPE